MTKSVFRALLLLTATIVLLSLLTACGHEHAYGEWTVEKNATCTENGTKVRVCECGETETETVTITYTGHTADEWIIDSDATCTDAGSKHQICSVCSDTIKTESIDAKGHMNGDWITDIDASCTEKGSKHQICSVCEMTIKTDDIPAKGHIEVIDKAVTPSSTETGLTEGKHCSSCNTTLVAQNIVNAAGHTNGAWITDKEATCTEKGSKHQVCSVCSATIKTEEISAKGHAEVVDRAVGATCTDTGLTEGKHCSRCNKILVAQTTVSAKGHSYSNKICSICYSHQPSEGLKFELHSNGKGYVVTGIGSCTDENLVIPETYNGKPVVQIGPAAFENNTRIKTVIVSNTVTSIRYDAFSNCSSLTSIVIPQNVTEVQSYAFFNCTALKHIYCETTYESPWGYPDGWSVYWNDYCSASVHWINEWHYVKGVPTVK